MAEPQDPTASPGLRLANEYTDVRLSLVRTGAGKRIRIESLRTGASADFDPTVIEALTTLDAAAIAALVDAFTEHGSAARAVRDG